MLQHMWLIMTMRPRLDRLQTKSLAVAFVIAALSALVSYARWQSPVAMAHFCLLWFIGSVVSPRFMLAYALLSIGCDTVAITTGQDMAAKLWELAGIVAIIIRDIRDE